MNKLDEIHSGDIARHRRAVLRIGPGLGLALAAAVLAAGCSVYAWTVPIIWSGKSQLQEVAQSAPHGTLVLRRDHERIFILVDDQAAFRSVSGKEASFRLAPGRHEIATMYNDGKRVSTEPLKGSFTLDPGQRITIEVESRGTFGMRQVANR